ncbi:MAG: UDP-N-acetylmuramoyl-tripeptide--D-alanyl-D-alanine ligase [Verrucomicrobia bacterium]|nr:UDP-N-acetylmuramoyl-tripeptide--D-alanyl-D-alanine ligase [Verrucomicrobiota bacterium]
MHPQTLESLVQDCHGQLRGGDGAIRVARITTDSRTVRPGDLFVCLRGPRFDGHQFAAAALRQGAVAVLGEPDGLPEAEGVEPAVIVPETRRALGELAAANRQRFAGPVVVVAGSNGKTTTKELVAAVLRQRFRTVASPASFNNDIGLPLTLLELGPAHEAAVVEAGTNHPGELAALLRLARPTHGILTRLGREHLEFFGSFEGVLEEEGALADFVPAEGVLVLIGDSRGAEHVARRARARVVRVGWSPRNDWSIRVACVSEAGTVFEVRTSRPGFAGDYALRLLGRHQVENALLALAIGAELGLDREAVAAGLASTAGAPRRLQYAVVGGVRVLDDSYNANADSMRAALETLSDVDCPGRRLAVLGDMGELGEHAAAAHEETGHEAARRGVDGLYAIGRWASALAAGARAAGLAAVREFPEATAAADVLLEDVRPGDVVLVKASRSTRLDVVADLLKRVLTARHGGDIRRRFEAALEPCSTT